MSPRGEGGGGGRPAARRELTDRQDRRCAAPRPAPASPDHQARQDATGVAFFCGKARRRIDRAPLNIALIGVEGREARQL